VEAWVKKKAQPVYGGKDKPHLASRGKKGQKRKKPAQIFISGKKKRAHTCQPSRWRKNKTQKGLPAHLEIQREKKKGKETTSRMPPGDNQEEKKKGSIFLSTAERERKVRSPTP